MKQSRNGRRLLAMPTVRDDVWFSVQRETLSFTAEMSRDGIIQKTGATMPPAQPDLLQG